MVLDWTADLPSHWIDRVEQEQQSQSESTNDLPEWADITLPPMDPDSPQYGTKALVTHILDHRESFDYDEFDRQLGVIMENEGSWITEQLQAAEVVDAGDSVSRTQNFDRDRDGLIDIANLITDRGFRIPTRGYAAMADLDHDGYMSANYGSFGRNYASSVVSDISRERVMSGQVPIPDDMGIDFSRVSNISPERARELTQTYDFDRAHERQERLRADLRRELDGITGPVDENSEIVRRIDAGRVSEQDIERAVGREKSEAELDAESNGPGIPLPLSTDESIEEMLAELDEREKNTGRDFDGPSL